MFAGTTGVAVIGVHVIQVHFVASNFPGKAGAGPRFDVRQVLRPGPCGLEGKAVRVAMHDLSLHRLIGTDSAGGTYPDVTQAGNGVGPGTPFTMGA
jgi:hypothetical protein